MLYADVRRYAAVVEKPSDTRRMTHTAAEPEHRVADVILGTVVNPAIIATQGSDNPVAQAQQHTSGIGVCHYLDEGSKASGFAFRKWSGQGQWCRHDGWAFQKFGVYSWSHDGATETEQEK